MAGYLLIYVGYVLVFWGMNLALHTHATAPLLYTATGLGPSQYS